uniref:Ninjurin 2 n=1 Tax=Sinocyclocheilus rhinocerous TaxID=307959 RepID=A0A673LSK5_9TELE
MLILLLKRSFNCVQARSFAPLIAMISLSISLQVTVGLLLIFIVKYDLNDVKKQPRLNTMNDMATVFVFSTVLINIFITYQKPLHVWKQFC